MLVVTGDSDSLKNCGNAKSLREHVTVNNNKYYAELGDKPRRDLRLETLAARDNGKLAHTHTHMLTQLTLTIREGSERWSIQELPQTHVASVGSDFEASRLGVGPPHTLLRPPRPHRPHPLASTQ